jgi:sigma-B regulation protein RsbU (phosphoserine phosphatase)
MASRATISRNRVAAAHAPRFLLRYVVLALLFAISVLFQIGSVRNIGDYLSASVPKFAPAEGTAVLRFVDARASAAGLRRGDILVAINGRPYTGELLLFEAMKRARPGESLTVTVRSPEPGAKERTVYLPVAQATRWATGQILFTVVVIPIFCLALGFWAAAVRPGDPLAWLLLGLMMSFAQLLSAEMGLEGWGVGLVKLTAGYSELLGASWPVFMFLFGFYFPEPLPIFRKRWRWLPAAAIIPYAAIAVVDAVASVIELTNVAAVSSSPVLPLLRAVLKIYIFGLVGAFFAFISFKSSMALSSDSKRRLWLLYWGATIALTPGFLYGLAFWLVGLRNVPDWLGPIVGLLLLLFPLTLAYVIVVQKAMDVRVVLRQGLQYALARNGVRTLQVLAILLVALTALALIGQNQERAQKLIVIALGLLAIFTIRRLSEKAGAWIDRRFFREAYDAEQVLNELSDGVRTMLEVRSLVETVAERISQTLHISRVAVLLGGGGPYRPAYAVGYGDPPDIAFPAGAGTVKVLERQTEPARVYFDDPHSWLYREPEITEEDRSKLTQLKAEVLLPLNTRDKLLGFISLGPKLSDEPYSRADLRLLKSVATQTGLALENAQLVTAIADEVAQRERLNSEVQIARDVQERLFPQKLVPIPGITYAGACRPAFGVGGDYYDFLALPGGRLGIAIGDVSGKGIAAALTMASLQASLRSEATRVPDNLGGLMGNVNRLLHEALAPNRYATFFYGQYDPELCQFTYVNAGHNPPMLFHPCDGGCQVSRLEASGTVVGLLEDAVYQQASLAIAPGDMLVAFTDGVTEAMNAAEEEWGEERLMQTVKSCLGLPPAEAIASIIRTADAFVAGAKQNDDMTLVVLSAR